MSGDPIRLAIDDLELASVPDIHDKLLKLKEFLQFYGRAANLTSKLDDASLDQHVIEALQLVALARRLGVQGRWLDIGSGGGFPGLVLAIGLPEVALTLVEPRAKRATVLELGLRKFGQPGARVLRGRVDGGRWQGIEGDTLQTMGFDAASARAVFDPQRWVREGQPWLREGGLLFVHLPVGAEVPSGLKELGRVERGKWGIVGGSCST